jgi:ribosome modulation factor
MTKLSHQAQSEYAAGYQSGLAGEPEPRREKGQSFFGGWLAGRADREQK